MPKLTILYSFTSPDLSLVEVKRLDLPEGSPVSDVYKWLVIFSKSQLIYPLQFKAMEKSETAESRTFNEGELKFNQHIAKFEFLNQEFDLLREDPARLDKTILALVEHYLK